jgi:formylglycine-generating enzyme required for sulfatase activity
VTMLAGEATYILEGQPPIPPVCIDQPAIRRWLDQMRSGEDVQTLGQIVAAREGQPCPATTADAPTATPDEPFPTAPSAVEGAESPPSDADLWINPIDNATYVRVPAGTFLMGAEGDARDNPARVVYLDTFWIGQTEVTNAQYAECVASNVCTVPTNSHWNDPTLADHPVTNVTWEQAQTYASWVGGRLPTEAEWEKAARGTDARPYPWGSEAPGAMHANLNFTIGRTVPVGSYPQGASPYGALDMAGNVEEWVADRYDPNYYTVSPDSNPQGPDIGMLRVLRGGSFTFNLLNARSFVRGKISPDAKFDSVGFRVAISALR